MRKGRALLLLLVAVTVASTAMFSTQASAVISYSEEIGGSCGSFVLLWGTDVDGGCRTHATSEGRVELRKHIFGIESHITSCNSEFSGRFESAGYGYLLEQVFSGAGCNRQACRVFIDDDPPIWEVSPWNAIGREGVPDGLAEGTEFLTTDFCVEPVGGGADETCEIDIPFQSYSNQHRQEYGHVSEMSAHGSPGSRCELVGHWNSETGGTHDGAAEQELVVTH